MSNKINWPSVFVLIIYPAILITLGVNYISDFQFGWFEAGLLISGYYIANITVGIGLHRLWSHDTYKINKYAEFILVLLSAGTLQGPTLSWASNHFKHHTYTDEEEDPHTPKKYKNRLMGFWWSHMGWMLVGEGSYKSIDKITMVKLGRNKMLRWQLKYYWQIATIMNTLLPALIGFAFGKTALAAYAGFLFIGLGRALQQQITFFVNSLCHFAGTQKYINSTAGDIWWLALLLLGENWHNFHHAFPSDYRNGAKWYQLDVHKWIIYLMSRCGLAWDLKRTAPVRVEAKVSQTMEQFINMRKEQLESINTKVNELALIVQEKITEIESSSNKIKDQFRKSLAQTQDNLNNIAALLNQQLKNFENPSERIIKMISKKVKMIEESLNHLHA
jgi:stearoyl-CoA desaturase (delta-9 desaturase)